MTHLYQKQIEEFQEMILQMDEASFNESDTMFEPIMTVLFESEGKTGLVIVPLGEMMQTDATKDFFVAVAPLIFEKLREEGKTPLCMSLTSEMWVRRTKASEGVPENWRDLPKTEALMTIFETEHSSRSVVRPITRNEGSKPNLEEPLPDMGKGMKGRIVNLFKKYKPDNNN